MEQNEALLAFYGALMDIQQVTKTQTANTGKYSYTYADLGDILDECKRACAAHMLAICQVPSATAEGLMTVQTILIHEEGTTVEFSPLTIRLPNDAQAFGSALTYARRYALMTIFGIAPEDDDGREATKAARAPEQYDGARSGAEQRIRIELRGLSEQARKEVQEDFRSMFGTGLQELPVSRHGEALEWVLQQVDARKEPADA